MNNKIRLLSLLLFALILAPAENLMGQPDYPGGVKFTGNYDPGLSPLSVNQRSEIILEEGGLLSTESLFRIELKFSLFSTISRGSFIKFSSSGKFKAEISHLPQLDNDTSYIRLQIETDKTYITDLPLLKKVQSLNTWNYLSVRFDFLMQRVVFTLNHETSDRRILLPLGEKKITLFNPETDPNPEIPDFCMRELKIITDDESLFFPFNEKSGSRAADLNNGKQLRLRNAEWLYPRFTDGIVIFRETNYPPAAPLTSYISRSGLLVYESGNGSVVFDPADGSFEVPDQKPAPVKNHGISTELNFEDNILYILNGNERYRVNISELDDKIRPDIGSFSNRNICYDARNGMIYGAFLGYDKSVAALERIEYYLLVYSYSIRENKFRLTAKKNMHILDFNNTVLIPRFERNELHFVSFAEPKQTAGSRSQFTQYTLLLSGNQPEPVPGYNDLFAGLKWYYFLFAGAAAAFTFSVIYRRKIISTGRRRLRMLRGDRIEERDPLTAKDISSGRRDEPADSVNEYIAPGIPMIQTFGKFEISDIYGNIVTERITGKRREILIYMLAKFQLQTASAFTPDELKTVFFADLTDEKFNKNLKVHLSNLRNNLKSMEMQSLKNDGLMLSPDTDFDLVRLNNLADRFEHGMFTNDDIKMMCDILGKGKFLSGEKVSGEWFRPKSDEISLKALNLIRGVISEYSGSCDSNMKLRLAHVLSVHAPLSEESLNLKVSVYLEAANAEAIRSVYEEFARNYKMITGDKYQRELSDILKGK